MRITARGLASGALAGLLSGSLLVAAPAQAADPVTINLIGINDFHGRIDADTLKWASTVEELKADGGGDANSLLVSAGDNVGASVFASAIQGDEPTIDILNQIGLDATAVGNHEFDQGYTDLVERIVPRADFDILGANVRKADGSRALPAYKIYTVAGVKVAVIGAVTQETPTLVSPDRVSGLTFGDPSDSINTAVAEINALPAADRPDVTVASFHEGAPNGAVTLEEALASNAVFRKLVNNTSADVDAIFMGHTHQKYVYNAPVPGQAGKTRPIVQTGQYGENVGQIKLSVDVDTDTVTAAAPARTVARSTALDPAIITQYPQLAAVKTIRDDAVAYAARVGNVEKGRITADITRAFTNPAAGTGEDRANESTLGNTVADALLYRVGKTTAGADIGIVNPGGLRTDLKYAGVSGDTVNTDGVVTRAELNTVLPFANNLNSVAVTGAVLDEILEQQWQTSGPGEPAPTRPYLQLGVSKNVTYTYDETRALGDRVTSVLINGQALDPAKTYKIATFSFLSAGGDNFRAFKKGVSTDTALVDRDGWETFFADKSPVSPDFAKRSVQARGVQDSYEAAGSVSIALSKLDLTSTGSPANTTVAATLTSGGTTVDVGSFPVTAGAATVAFDLPVTAVGASTLTLKAAPSNTTVSIPLNVAKAGSTTTATAPARAKTGTTFTVEASVASAVDLVPTGTVTVKEGSTTLASGPLVDGAASVEVNASKLSADEHELTVAYSGDANHAPSTGAAGTIDIVKGGSGFGAVAAAGTYGRPVKIKVSADPEAAGLIYVTEDGRAVGMGFLAKGGSGTITLDGTTLEPGTHSLVAFFGGDEKFDPTSTAVAVKIAKGSTSITKISLSPKKIVKKRTKAFVTVTVKGVGGFEVDGGKVTLRQSGKSYSGTVKDGKVRIRI
ncbi:MAG: 5'-nucleotidase C-terminal domain-containing protein, partial [Aeromicrobium sp.]